MKKVVITMFIIIFCFYTQIFATQIENTNTSNEETTNTIKEENTTKEENKVKEEKPTSIEKNETMYVQERCNIRSSYSVDSDRVGGLDAGTEVKVVEEYSNGWYKINYNGKTAFVKAGILRSTPPVKEEEQEEEKQEPEETTQEENVTPDQNQENNQEKATQNPDDQVQEEVPQEMDEEYTNLMNNVGVLPEVGTNIAYYLYALVVFISILSVIFIKSNKGDK